MVELLCELFFKSDSFDTYQGTEEDEGKLRFDIPIELLLSVTLPVEGELTIEQEKAFVNIILKKWDEKTQEINKNMADWLESGIKEAIKR